MILKIRFPRPGFPVPRGGFSALAATPAPAGATFHAMLTDCMDDWVVEHRPNAGRASASVARAGSSVTRGGKRKPRASEPGSLARAWSWLQGKYAQTATKRLRVSETVSLGEKRFVALVCVEGREFLIGGGSSGVSMLTPLGVAKGTARELDGGELDGVEESE